MEVWLYAAALVIGIKSICGEIRCYCNDASCVNKGYMCKSSVDLCFLALTPDGASAFRAVQGCAELLPERLLSTCRRPEADSEHASQQLEEVGSDLDAFRSRLVCCANDMCNYNVDIVQGSGLTPEAKSNSRLSALQAQKNLNGKTSGDSSEERAPGVHHIHEDGVRRDIWFRAAVIAVPIAGVVILVLLVLVAVRMLRGDLGGHIIKSSTTIHRPPYHRGISVTIVDESGDIRTVLAPHGADQNWTEKELGFKLESTKGHKYEKFRPSSDCSESDCCDCCSSLANNSSVCKNGNGVPV